MEVLKESCLINLQDEDGKLYKCMIPRGDYTKIMDGDYNLANKYLQIQKKKRLPASEDLKENGEIKEEICVVVGIGEPSNGINANSLCKSNLSDDAVDTESWETQNLLEYSELPQLENEIWSYNAVLALIASVATHHKDLNHPKNKRKVWSKVSNELKSKQFRFSENACYNKWRSLLRSYKSTKDKKNSTGQKATRFMFYNQMDDLLGRKSSICSRHTTESSEEPEASVSEINITENTEDTTNTENKKRMNELWSYNAVLALIASVATHHKDLNHPKEKKYDNVWSNVSNELRSKQFKFSENACYNKWRSLLRSYRATEDKKKSTGQRATRFLFYDKMDELLGQKRLIRSGHNIESSDSEEPESSVSEIYIMDNTENTTNPKKENKKRKRKPIIQLEETAKQKRHKDRMAMEEKKIKIEEKKIQLLQKLIDKI